MIKWINKKRNQKGFTLIELVVVIAILGILAALAIPRFTGARETANDGVILSNLRNIQSAVELYAADNNVAVTSINTDTNGAGTGEGQVDIAGVLGAWPDGPGENTTYSVVGGEARASVDTNLPSEFKGKTVHIENSKLAEVAGGGGV